MNRRPPQPDLFTPLSPPDVQDRSPQRPQALAKGTAHPHGRPWMWRRGTRRAARAKKAIKRMETELLRAGRARSRTRHAFRSAVLVRIETETDERRNVKPARSLRHMAAPGHDARTQD
jgi:hypothetical protein